MPPPPGSRFSPLQRSLCRGTTRSTAVDRSMDGFGVSVRTLRGFACTRAVVIANRLHQATCRYDRLPTLVRGDARTLLDHPILDFDDGDRRWAHLLPPLRCTASGKTQVCREVQPDLQISQLATPQSAPPTA